VTDAEVIRALRERGYTVYHNFSNSSIAAVACLSSGGKSVGAKSLRELGGSSYVER
jgi:hypothetical protein